MLLVFFIEDCVGCKSCLIFVGEGREGEIWFIFFVFFGLLNILFFYCKY